MGRLNSAIIMLKSCVKFEHNLCKDAVQLTEKREKNTNKFGLMKKNSIKKSSKIAKVISREMENCSDST